MKTVERIEEARIVRKIKDENKGVQFVYTKRRIHDVTEPRKGSCNLRNIEGRKKYTKDEINEMIDSKTLRLPKCDHCLSWEDVEIEETD